MNKKVTITLEVDEAILNGLNNAIAAYGDICWSLMLGTEVPAKFEPLKQKSEELEDQLFVSERCTNNREAFENGINAYVEYGVQYIFYDYIGSIPDVNNTQEYKALTNEADVLQKICMKNDVCIVAACQTNGNIYNSTDNSVHEYTANDISGSKALANKAKVVLFLYDEGNKKTMTIWKAKRWFDNSPKNLKFQVQFEPKRVRVSSYKFDNEIQRR